MIGNDYYFTGINLQYGYSGNNKYGWGAILDFQDSGFANDQVAAGIVSTEGSIRTRYALRDENGVSGAQVALESILNDAAKMGIKSFNEFRPEIGIKVTIFVSVQDAEDPSMTYYDIPKADLVLIRKLAAQLDFNLIENEH